MFPNLHITLSPESKMFCVSENESLLNLYPKIVTDVPPLCAPEQGNIEVMLYVNEQSIPLYGCLQRHTEDSHDPWSRPLQSRGQEVARVTDMTSTIAGPTKFSLFIDNISSTRLGTLPGLNNGTVAVTGDKYVAG